MEIGELKEARVLDSVPRPCALPPPGLSGAERKLFVEQWAKEFVLVLWWDPARAVAVQWKWFHNLSLMTLRVLRNSGQFFC